jgi:peroxiredoxin
LLQDLTRPIAQLIQSGATEQALTEGAPALDFTLPDAFGNPVTLSHLLQQGPVVITFYRGAWCPYCKPTLRAYQQASPQIQEAGASLVAISPQTPEHSRALVEKEELTFAVLSDVRAAGRGAAAEGPGRCAGEACRDAPPPERVGGGSGGGLRPAAAPQHAEALYRIVQEALSNVVKHARARRAGIVVAPREGGVGVGIEDDGVGVPAAGPAVGAFGLRGMHERVRTLGGTVWVGNRSTGGAYVSADLPMSSAQDA